jgi:four helix bundle protein
MDGIIHREKGFQKLIVWQKAHELVLLIYRIVDSFPKREIFGLTSQICRAAVSVPASIAEGSARREVGYLLHRLIGSLGRHN